jgi:hypothetical protein
MMHQKRMHAAHAIVGGDLFQRENPIPRRPAYEHKAAATRNAWADRSESLWTEGSSHI